MGEVVCLYPATLAVQPAQSSAMSAHIDAAVLIRPYTFYIIRLQGIGGSTRTKE